MHPDCIRIFLQYSCQTVLRLLVVGTHIQYVDVASYIVIYLIYLVLLFIFLGNRCKQCYLEL